VNSHSDRALTQQQRDQILNALQAIEGQVKRIAKKSDWQALYVIGTNLTIIRANVINTAKATPN
jgi:hypothetical protein